MTDKKSAVGMKDCMPFLYVHALMYISVCVSLEEWGVTHYHKILQMGVHVGGPRNLPKSLCRIHAIFGASEFRCQSSQVSSTVCTSSGPWIKSFSK